MGKTYSPVPSTRDGSGAIEEAIPDESDPQGIEQETENTTSRFKEHTYKSTTETPPDGKKEQDGVNKRAKDPQGHTPKSKSRMRKTPARTHQGGCEKHTTKLEDRNPLGCTSLHGRRR